MFLCVLMFFTFFLILVLPSFLKKPRDNTIRAGTTARLECAAEGHPVPEIAWQKDGGTDFPAARERRMLVMPEDDVFFITDVKIEDMGVYSCTAQNSAGSVSANATLTVLGELPGRSSGGLKTCMKEKCAFCACWHEPIRDSMRETPYNKIYQSGRMSPLCDFATHSLGWSSIAQYGAVTLLPIRGGIKLDALAEREMFQPTSTTEVSEILPVFHVARLLSLLILAHTNSQWPALTW